MHDSTILNKARDLLYTCVSTIQIRDLICDRVERNEAWRGRRCINLVAAESPTSPAVRKMLSAEVGIRASGGHIGRRSRCFAGMREIDELEAICIELLKQLFTSNYADHRLLGGMHACHVVYTALAKPGDTVMTISPFQGGDTSNRLDGPPGARGLKVVDIPFDPHEFMIDIDQFYKLAKTEQPKLVGLGLTMALFHFPLQEIKKTISEWGGLLYFDAAHQAGLIAGKCFDNPLKEGADIITGSSGKTFSGPQGGLIVWNDAKLAKPVVETIFPVLTGSHQINRVAALAIAATEMLEYGSVYMKQVKTNAKRLASALHQRGLSVLYQHKGYTETHQIMIDVSKFGSGLIVAQKLEAANIIINKMLLPWETNAHTDEPLGIRLGTVEVTRLGMGNAEMNIIADFIARLLIENEPPKKIRRDVVEFREPFQQVYYCHEHGYPDVVNGEIKADRLSDNSESP